MAELDEISHSGGQVTIRKKDGAYQLGVRHCNPHRMTMIQIAVSLPSPPNKAIRSGARHAGRVALVIPVERRARPAKRRGHPF
jgi:hypothetical protein